MPLSYEISTISIAWLKSDLQAWPRHLEGVGPNGVRPSRSRLTPRYLEKGVVWDAGGRPDEGARHAPLREGRKTTSMKSDPCSVLAK